MAGGASSNVIELVLEKGEIKHKPPFLMLDFEKYPDLEKKVRYDVKTELHGQRIKLHEFCLKEDPNLGLPGEVWIPEEGDTVDIAGLVELCPKGQKTRIKYTLSFGTQNTDPGLDIKRP